jgi:Calcineurin-like phosphoesterase
LRKKDPLSDDEFIELFEEIGCTALSRRLGLTARRIYQRREKLIIKLGRRIDSPNRASGVPKILEKNIDVYPDRVDTKIENGLCIIGSDCHYWPGKPSVMHRAFVHFCKELKPSEVILNGDIIDSATISSFPAQDWSHRPTVQEEIETAQERLHEIAQAAGKAKKRITRGNHDSRFERRLLAKAPEFAKVHGFNMADHFPLWEFSVAIWINDDVVVKHRFKGGMYAARNSTLYGGKNIILGDGHRQIVHPYTDYGGTRWGVDAGCIADVNHPAFRYTEGNAKDWRSGFCVITFIQGKMLAPELISDWDERHVQWRGKLVRV